jgi:hypothetical protein
MAASEAEAMPLPREDTTPPVTKIRGVMRSTPMLVKAYSTGTPSRPRVLEFFRRGLDYRRPSQEADPE